MRKLGQGKVLILEITHKAFFFFYIGLIQQGTSKMTSVSPPRGRLTVHLRSMHEQDASFLQCCNARNISQTAGLKVLQPTRATVSAVRRFIDKLTLALQWLHTKNIVGIFLHSGK